MIAFVFPGQGSQKPGMGRELVDRFLPAAEVFELCSSATGLDLHRICFELDEETLRQTQNAQIALYACGVAAFRALGAPRAAAFAGHSVGEYAALAAAGVFSVEDGARLVKRRGELMASSGSERPGTMAAVLGLERPDLEAVCREASTTDSVVVIANDNCPGQLVISGDVEAVGRASALASEKGAKRVIPINVSGAFHSPLMERPARQMGDSLAQAVYKAPSAPVYANVTAAAVSTGEPWARLLEDQLRNPVRWTESVVAMRAAGITTFVECGSGEVLCALIRRIDRDATTMAAFDAATVESSVAAMGSEVTA